MSHPHPQARPSDAPPASEPDLQEIRSWLGSARGATGQSAKVRATTPRVADEHRRRHRRRLRTTRLAVPVVLLAAVIATPIVLAYRDHTPGISTARGQNTGGKPPVIAGTNAGVIGDPLTADDPAPTAGPTVSTSPTAPVSNSAAVSSAVLSAATNTSAASAAGGSAGGSGSVAGASAGGSGSATTASAAVTSATTASTTAAKTSPTITVPSTPVTTIAQIVTDVPVLPADVLAAADGLKTAWGANPSIPLILTYHDIAVGSTSNYAVTPAQFAEQMATLDAAGAHTLTATEFADYVRGKVLPPRSVLITLDDGTRGVWRYADTILAQHKFHAISAIVTSFVGTRKPYYMTWDEISRLDQNGRWDFENHTDSAHMNIAINAAGDQGSFLSHLAWLPSENRMETPLEYQVRVSADLDRSIVELKSRGLGRGGLFAFPFSDYGASGNDPGIANLLITLANQRFVAVFNDDARPRPLNGPFQFNRLGMTAKTTPLTMVEGLRAVLELSRPSAGSPPG